MRHSLALTLTAAMLGGMPLAAIAQDSSGAGQDTAEAGQQAQSATQSESNSQDAQGGSSFETQQQELSYAIGVQIGTNFQRQQLQLDTEVLTQGIRDSMEGQDLKMSQEQLQQTLLEFQQRMREQMQQQQQQLQEQQQQMQGQGEDNAQQSQQFLEENRQKEGVEVTDSGLQYEVMEEGEGESPQMGDTVTVHYEGTLPNGETFDSSYQRGQPAQFQVGQVIEGWNEALMMMKPGSKYRLAIPSDLAYGERGAPRGGIGPNQALVFEVELMDVTQGGGNAGGGM